MIYEVLLVAYLIVALLLIGFVLIQQGKGADMGASLAERHTAPIIRSDAITIPMNRVWNKL